MKHYWLKKNKFKVISLIFIIFSLLGILVLVRQKQTIDGNASERSERCAYASGENACEALIAKGFPCKWEIQKKACVASGSGGTLSCRKMTFKKGTVSSSHGGAKVAGKCDYGVRELDCVGLNIKTKDGSPSNCRWTGTSGTAKLFLCDMPYNLVAEASCKLFTNSPMNCCSQVDKFK